MNSSIKAGSLAVCRGVAVAAILSLAALSFTAHAQDSDPQVSSAQSAGQSPLSSADAATVEQVKSALDSNSGVDAKHVKVTMDKGKVVLSGMVMNNRAIVDAARIASKAAGGRKVVNNLTVQQNSTNAP